MGANVDVLVVLRVSGLLLSLELAQDVLDESDHVLDGTFGGKVYL